MTEFVELDSNEMINIEGGKIPWGFLGKFGNIITLLDYGYRGLKWLSEKTAIPVY